MAFASASEARLNKWFSRKYQSGEVHSNNSQANQDRLADKSDRCWQRTQEARKRTTAQKLARLPIGGESKREIARLTARLEREKAQTPKPKPAKAPQPTKGKQK